MMSFRVWLPHPMFLLREGVSVSGPVFLLGGLCLGSLPDRDPLDTDPPEQKHPPGQRPSYGKERPIRNLLKCILVFNKIYFPSNSANLRCKLANLNNNHLSMIR